MGANDEKVLEIIEKLPSDGHFLEVGVMMPHIPRLHALIAKNIHFWGMDTQEVCHRIWNKIHPNYHPHMTLIGNEKQDYNWSLMTLVKALKDRTGTIGHFDTVFLDGHHTLFVDGFAMHLCSTLLKPGGYLLVDDDGWSLNQQETNIRQNDIYNSQYVFENYTEEQRAVSHLSLMIDYLIPTLGKFTPIIERFAWQKQ
jgi:hypothetical protein